MIPGARRKQVLFTISMNNIVVEENKIVLRPSKTLKQRNTRRSLEPLIFHRYAANNKLCIAACVKSYLGIRGKLVHANVIEFITIYGKPHKPASSDTRSRWINNELGYAGINTNVYIAHSCRTASTGKARGNGISLTQILMRRCWKNENTFLKFYSKDIMNQNSREDFNFVQPLLYSSEMNF